MFEAIATYTAHRGPVTPWVTKFPVGGLYQHDVPVDLRPSFAMREENESWS